MRKEPEENREIERLRQQLNEANERLLKFEIKQLNDERNRGMFIDCRYKTPMHLI